MKSGAVLRGLVRLVLLAALCLPLAFAQLNRGTLTGIVTDPSGAVVPAVKVTAIHVETGTSTSAVSSETGSYTIPALQIGTYRLEFESASFKRGIRNGVELAAGSTLRQDVTLEIGSVGESVQVTAQASPLETETTRQATTIQEKLVQDMPLFVNGSIRSVVSLALIAPETKTVGGNLRIGGGQASGWEMMMDGQPLSSASTAYQDGRAPLASVPIDAIGEFTVEANGMKAEFGRASGAVTFSTKSGTNQVHGNLFEELRNDAMDARGFFASQPPKLKQHDFGGTVGGPIYIPKIYDGRNKTFFFATYQGFRNRAGRTPSYQTIPTPENYLGDFRGWTRSGVMVPIYDTSSTRPNPNGSGYVRNLIPNNMIPQSQFSGVATRFIALRPPDMVPNTSGRNAFGDPVENYFRDAGSTTSPWDKGSIRLDHTVNSKNRVSGLFLKGQNVAGFGADGPPGLPMPFNGGAEVTTRSTSIRISLDTTLSPRVINTVRGSYQKESGIGIMLTADEKYKFNEKLRIPGVPGPDRALPQVSFTAYSGWGGAFWGGDAGGNFNLSDDVTFIRDKHTIKTGFFYTHDRWDGYGQHRPNGGFGFSYQATGLPGDTSQNTGNAFASFLLGYATSGGLETPRNVRQVWDYMGGYVQDDWRVRPNLTINLGLRYEYTMPIKGGAYTGLKTWEELATGKIDGFTNFDPTVPNPKAGGRLGALVYSGSGTGRLQGDVFDGYPWAFGPRLGIVWRAGKGFVVRSSGGRTFSAVKSTGGSTHFDGFILNTNYSSADNSINDFFTTLDAGIPWGAKGLPPSAASLPFIDPSLDNDSNANFWQRSDSGRPGTYDTWTLDIQKEITPSMSLTVAYSGSKGTHIASGLMRYNQIPMSLLEKYGRTLLNSSINSAGARAANIPIPYAGFGNLTAHTVQRALSPYPQYANVYTSGGGPGSVGERAGDSTYHALVMKLDRRFSNGLSLLASYVLSKQFSNAESASNSSGGALDHYNKGLDKSLAGSDQTHVTRIAFSYDLPFGNGKALSFNKPVNFIIGGWTLSSFLSYESGTPDSVASGASPIGTGSRVFITSYEGWRAPVSGEKFDPNKDLWYDKNAFNQGITQATLDSRFGNATRNNPKLRSPWNLNENIALGRTFRFAERKSFEIRGEAFNVMNRVRWGGANSGITSASFGRVTSQGNTPRRMQIGMKLFF
ncbi:MAG: TonB-dependent receptor [Candidatus Solibacter sp.]